jgi:hypothetical protein
MLCTKTELWEISSNTKVSYPELTETVIESAAGSCLKRNTKDAPTLIG